MDPIGAGVSLGLDRRERGRDDRWAAVICAQREARH